VLFRSRAEITAKDGETVSPGALLGQIMAGGGAVVAAPVAAPTEADEAPPRSAVGAMAGAPKVAAAVAAAALARSVSSMCAASSLDKSAVSSCSASVDAL
jgi:2-oxoglutarate dehydrogenase E2 component (dihydrolipoamide succinyltransferase)